MLRILKHFMCLLHTIAIYTLAYDYITSHIIIDICTNIYVNISGNSNKNFEYLQLNAATLMETIVG